MQVAAHAIRLVCGNCASTGSNTVAWITLAIAGTSAILTAVLAVATWRSATSAKDAAQASEKAATETARAADASAAEAQATLELVQLGNKQMRAAQLPIVIPVQVQFAAQGMLMLRDTAIAAPAMRVPVRNVGMGPAIALTLRIDQVHHQVGLTELDQPDYTRARRAALGAGNDADLVVRLGSFPGVMVAARVTLDYRDASGRAYRTTGRYNLLTDWFESLTQTAVDPEGNPTEELLE